MFLFLDCIDKAHIKSYLTQLKGKKLFFDSQKSFNLTPAQIRHHILQYAYRQKYDLLIFMDFDEITDINLIESHIKQIDKYDFGFHDFFITDFNLKLIQKDSFFVKKNIPNKIKSPQNILQKNFIGLGGTSIKPSSVFKNNFSLPQYPIYAYDWFLFTYMLLHQCRGIQIKDTFAYYRQHKESFTCITQQLTPQLLNLGLKVKKTHYLHFSIFSNIFKAQYHEILKLEQYLQQNQEKYIKIINQNFSPATLCWWENIKTLKEIKQWI